MIANRQRREGPRLGSSFGWGLLAVGGRESLGHLIGESGGERAFALARRVALRRQRRRCDEREHQPEEPPPPAHGNMRRIRRNERGETLKEGRLGPGKAHLRLLGQG